MLQTVHTLLTAAPFVLALIVTLSFTVGNGARPEPKTTTTYAGRHHASVVYAAGQRPVFTRQLLVGRSPLDLTYRQQHFITVAA